MGKAFTGLTDENRIQFPPLYTAEPDGFLVGGGELSPVMILSAYEQGVFPWYNPGDPILWWSPDPRFILEPKNLHVGERLGRALKKNSFTFTMDTCFEEVIKNCAQAPRKGQPGTWIGREMIRAYTGLHYLGFAHSLEVWKEDSLAGGLYGLSLGSCFFGESMFSFVHGASKAAFITLVTSLAGEGFSLFDCQMRTPHLAALGADDVPRDVFLEKLVLGMEHPTRRGSWNGLLSRESMPDHGSDNQGYNAH